MNQHKFVNDTHIFYSIQDLLQGCYYDKFNENNFYQKMQ